MFGLEESYGYLRGIYARDKDAVVASMLVCEAAADYKSRGMTLYDGLCQLYEKYGYFLEKLHTITLTGIDGTKKIGRIMTAFRESELPVQVINKLDYINGLDGLPPSDVLKFFVDGGWFAVRPSGTEPKIKFYFGMSSSSREQTEQKLSELIDAICGFIDKIE